MQTTHKLLNRLHHCDYFVWIFSDAGARCSPVKNVHASLATQMGPTNKYTSPWKKAGRLPSIRCPRNKRTQPPTKNVPAQIHFAKRNRMSPAKIMGIPMPCSSLFEQEECS